MASWVIGGKFLYIFKKLKEVQEITDSWVIEYNEERPHESLGNLTPKEYLTES